MNNNTPPSRILLLSHARTASHLLEKMLSRQPNVSYSKHAFMDARRLHTKLLEEGPYDASTSPDTRAELKLRWQRGYEAILRAFDEAERGGMIAFHHEHPHFFVYPQVAVGYCYGGDSDAMENDEDGGGGREYFHVVAPAATTATATTATGATKQSYTSDFIVPDDFLLHPGTRPIFTIRHPGVMIPSIYSTKKETSASPSWASMAFSSSLRWSRLLYDWYAEHGPSHGIHPVIVDADDFMTTDKKCMDELCRRVGLDAGAVIYSWDKASEEEKRAMGDKEARILRTILESDGLVKGKTAVGFELGEAKREWVGLYGEDAADEIEGLVTRTMGEYEYLRGKKMAY